MVSADSTDATDESTGDKRQSERTVPENGDRDSGSAKRAAHGCHWRGGYFHLVVSLEAINCTHVATSFLTSQKGAHRLPVSCLGGRPPRLLYEGSVYIRTARLRSGTSSFCAPHLLMPARVD